MFYRAKSEKLQCRNTLTPYERYWRRNVCASHSIYNSCMNNLVFSVIKAKFDRKNCVRTVAKHSIFLERGFFLCARSLIKVIPYYFDNEGVHMRKTCDS